VASRAKKIPPCLATIQSELDILARDTLSATTAINLGDGLLMS